jgi:hydrogenase maturation factor
MADRGKVDRSFFEEQIRPRLGADRDDVALGPTHGVDFGVVDLGERALVVATDPVSILPRLGWERAARFALDIVLADVAVSGLAPTHLTVSFALPPEMSDETFGAVWGAIHEECADLGTAVVSGHTARYDGCSFPWVGAATAVAVGDADDVVRPDGARPGDDLLVTKGPAVEAVGLLSTLFPDPFPLRGDALATAQARLAETRAVRDALTAAAAGPVTAMHDATEGGLLGALEETAESAGVRLDVDAGRVPFRPGVREACDALGLDPWRASSAGTLLVTVPPEGTADVLSALEDRGTDAARVGRVAEGSGVRIDGERPGGDGDPTWAVYEALAAESEST